MTMISYAQNFEDVMLWRCFKNIEKGFYIDVGANDPVLDSVSLAFYNKGWRGINIEPSTAYYQKLLEARAGENNIQVALGAESGEITFYDIPSTGLSTTDLKIARQHESQGLSFTETKIKQKTLDDIFADVNQDVHWLKIDVEGAEKQVLQGWKTSLVRPWVLIIESTLPRTDVETYDDWEKYVLDKGYQFVYFDGLNRFYISDKHPELKQYFQTPPNVFDEFVVKKIVDLNEAVEYEKKLANDFNKQLIEAKNAFSNAHHRIEYVETQLSETQALLRNNAIQFQNLEELQAETENSLNKTKAALNETINNLANKQEQLQKISVRLEQTQSKLDRTQAWGDSVQNRTYELEGQIDMLKQHTVHLETQIDNMLTSFSWRITSPIRWLRVHYNAIFRTKRGFRQYVKTGLSRLANFISRHPGLHKFVVTILKVVGLHGKAKSLRYRVSGTNEQHQLINSNSQNIESIPITHGMTSNAKRIFYVIEQEKMSQANKGGV